MTALLDAIARAFVAPRAQERRPAAVAVAAPAVAVCGPAAQPLACALALLLRRSGPVVVCRWGAGARRAEVPATARARRLTASLTARGLAARASGRLVLVTLDANAPVAAAEAGRAAAAAGDAPVVLALCGPRDAAFDGLLAVQDAAVVATGDAPEELVALGVAGLADHVSRVMVAPALSGAGAWAARAGLAALPAARAALAPVAAQLDGAR